MKFVEAACRWDRELLENSARIRYRLERHDALIHVREPNHTGPRLAIQACNPGRTLSGEDHLRLSRQCKPRAAVLQAEFVRIDDVVGGYETR